MNEANEANLPHFGLDRVKLSKMFACVWNEQVYEYQRYSIPFKGA
jgi:hypothetical protein